MEFCDSSVTGGRIGGANEMKRGYAERVSEQSPSVEKRKREYSRPNREDGGVKVVKGVKS